MIEITRLRAYLLSNVDEKGKRIPDYLVAGATKIPGATLSKYASGKLAFSHKHLTALCRYFHVPPKEIGGWLRFTYSEEDE